MSRAVTLAELTERTRQMSDMENSQFVTDGEIKDYLNHAIAEWYDLCIGAYGEDWAVYPYAHEISVTAGTSVYALPGAFYKLRGIDRKVGSDDWEEIQKARSTDRNLNALYDRDGSENFGYRIFGGTTIVLIPTPQTSTTIRIWYIPAPSKLVNTTDEFDGVAGWEEYVVCDAAAKCLMKEESDPSFVLMRKEAMRQRIETMADERDTVGIDVIRDVRGGWWPWNTWGYDPNRG